MKALMILLCLIAFGFARKGPNFTSLRAAAMGNAFVALVDDREAIYYNPAGLNLINRLGNYEKRPDLGYYVNNWLDMRLNTRVILPDMLGVGLDAYRFKNNHEETIDKLGGVDQIEALSKDSSLYNDVTFIDRLALPFGVGFSGELAFHNFGGAIWGEASASPLLDVGVVVPGFGVEYVEANLSGQMAFAANLFDPNLSLGLGGRLVKSEKTRSYEVGLDNYETLTDTLDKKLEEIRNDIENFSTVMDFGVLYQIKRDVRLGAALQNVYFNKLLGQSVTPELTVGVAYSPRRWQNNSNFGRKLNFALDFEDLLNDDREYKFFSKVNFGFEIEQVLVTVPYLAFGEYFRFAKTRFGAGFKGGYWTLGAGLELLSVLHFEFATWSEERGYYTGQNPERTYVGNVGIGF
jgi:hypothetical protein